MSIIQQQRELWNTFSPGWEKWDAFVMEWLRPIGEALVQAVKLEEHDVVLDVATGTGEPGLTAATKVKKGKVIGIDVASWLSGATKHGLPNPKTSNGSLYYCKPRSSRVAWFGADFVKSCLNCVWESSDTYSSLGVRVARKK